MQIPPGNPYGFWQLLLLHADFLFHAEFRINLLSVHGNILLIAKSGFGSILNHILFSFLIIVINFLINFNQIRHGLFIVYNQNGFFHPRYPPSCMFPDISVYYSYTLLFLFY